jgi:hypothetical protein
MCIFYSPVLRSPDGNGVCRRHPPVAYAVGPNASVSVWPVVKPSDWCADGEQGVSHDSLQAGKELMKGDKGNGHRH